MAKKWIKLIFALLAVLLLMPWAVAFARDVGVVEEEKIQIKVAEPSALPSWGVFGRAIGGVNTPGDLFYIDATDNSADILVTLYLSNTEELIHYYRYMILKVGVYVQTDANEWEKASPPIPDTYITLRNGQVSFTLPGYAKYKVTIASGCFYCVTINTDKGNVSPQFYLTVD